MALAVCVEAGQRILDVAERGEYLAPIGLTCLFRLRPAQVQGGAAPASIEQRDAESCGAVRLEARRRQQSREGRRDEVQGSGERDLGKQIRTCRGNVRRGGREL